MRIARGISIANTSKPISTAAAFDADAVAFFTAANITDTTQKNAVNQLVLDLKAASIWTKMKALYPVVGGVASAHAVNLKSPGTYNLSFATGWTHSSTGMTPNGATYADTNLVPSINLSNLNTHLSYYSRTNSTSDIYTMASISADFNNLLSLYANYQGTMYSSMYSGVNGRVTGAVSRGDGFFMGSRTSSISHKIYRNTTLVNTSTTSTSLGSLPNANMLIGCLTTANIDSNKECAFASIGDGLTDAEASSFYNAVQTYQTTLGRQV